VTEREVQCGMLQSRDPASTSFCITRRITNLVDNVQHPRARKFIDVVVTESGSVSVDAGAQQLLSSLQHDKIAAVFDSAR